MENRIEKYLTEAGLNAKKVVSKEYCYVAELDCDRIRVCKVRIDIRDDCDKALVIVELPVGINIHEAHDIRKGLEEINGEMDGDARFEVRVIEGCVTFEGFVDINASDDALEQFLKDAFEKICKHSDAVFAAITEAAEEERKYQEEREKALERAEKKTETLADRFLNFLGICDDSAVSDDE